MTVALGLDGGGRKTHVIVSDASGTLLGAGEAGASNWEMAGVDDAMAAIGTAADQALGEAGLGRSDVEAAVFGLAGLDWAADVHRMDAAIGSLGFGGERRLVNDAFVALRAGCPSPWGLVVISGTGTIVAGRDPAGTEFRTLGLGRVFGDFGSELDVSELAVRAVADAYVGRGPSTMLSDLLCARAGVGSVQELLERISRADTRLRSPDVANMAPLVLRPRPATWSRARSWRRSDTRWGRRPDTWPNAWACATSTSRWSLPAACSGRRTATCWTSSSSASGGAPRWRRSRSWRRPRSWGRC